MPNTPQALDKQFTFSGTPSLTRIHLENLSFILEELVNILLWIFFVCGLVSFTVVFIAVMRTGQSTLFFQFSTANILFWFGFIAAIILTIKIKSQQKQLAALRDQQTLAAVDIYNFFSPESKKAWNQAILQSNGSPVSVEGLFLTLLTQSSIKKILARIHVSTHDMAMLVTVNIKLATGTKNINNLPLVAFKLAQSIGSTLISGPILLCALVSILPEDHIIEAIFSNIKITTEDLKILAKWQLKLPVKNSDIVLACCYRAQQLEHSQKCFFKYQAIKQACTISQVYHKGPGQAEFAYKLLAKAALAAHLKHKKFIGETAIHKAFGHEQTEVPKSLEPQGQKRLIARII